MKKLLLVFAAVSCAVVYSEKYNENKENSEPELEQQLKDYENQKNLLHKSSLLKEELADYEKEKRGQFREALVISLREGSATVETLAGESAREYTQEEESSRKLQDDAVLGWVGGCPPTEKSINGRICTYIVKRKDGKARINNELKKTFSEYKETFNTKVLPALRLELKHKEYQMEETFLRGLNRCENSKDGFDSCLSKQAICLSDIKKDGFFDDFIFVSFEQIINDVKKESIPLTDDEIIAITKRIYPMDTLDDSKNKVLTKLRDILYPKKDGADSSNIQHNFNKDDSEQD